MPDESTQLSLAGSDTSADAETATTTDTASSRSQLSSTASSAESDQRTEFHAAALPAWRQTHEDAGASYGFLEIHVTAITDLSGPQYALGCRREIVHPDQDGLPHAMVGWGGVAPEGLLDTIRNWRLRLLSQPYDPDPDLDLESLHGSPPVRTIPADRCRVFVADRVGDALQAMGHDDLAGTLGPTVQRVNGLPEHPSSEKERDLVATRADIVTQIGAGGTDGTLQQRARRLEQTIRANCGFTARYGHQVPDPVPEFADLDLNTLNAELEAVRGEIAHQEERLDQIAEQLAQRRDEWVAETRETHLPS